MSEINKNALFDPKLVIPALKESFFKLNPQVQLRNPVMFVTLIGAIFTTTSMIFGIGQGSKIFEFQIALWLWFTVFFANFAEAIAEGRGKAQAESLKKMRTQTLARLITGKKETSISAADLKMGNIVVCEAGNIIPGDGEVIEGIASVDESAITGESAPVIRESGGDRSAVTGGTRVISDQILIRITAEPGNSFLDRMIALVEGAKRQKTPNEIALSIVLAGLTIVFVLAVLTLKPFADYSALAANQDLSAIVTVPVLIALLVCLIPTTIGGLLSAIGISGMDRLIRRNVIATSGRAVEAAGDIDVLLLDKTGTITLGNRMATAFLPVGRITVERLAEAAQLASLADETPEGRSIVVLAKDKFSLRAESLQPHGAVFIPFSANTRMSGIDFNSTSGLKNIRKGAGDSIKDYVKSLGGMIPKDLDGLVSDVAKKGGTPLVVADGNEILGVVQLKDIVKGGIKERFAELRKMGIRTVMITGSLDAGGAAFVFYAFLREHVDPNYWAKLKAQNPRLYPSAAPTVTNLARGEYPVAFTGAQQFIASIRSGDPIKMVVPTEGIPSYPISGGIVTGTRRPNAAKVLVNWLTSKRAGDFIKVTTSYPIHPDAVLPEAPGIELPPLSQLWNISIEHWEETRTRYSTEWRSVFGQ